MTATYELLPVDIAALAHFQASNDRDYQYSRWWQSLTVALIIVLIGAVIAAMEASFREALVPLGISVLIAIYFFVTRYREYPRRFARYAMSRYQGEEFPGSLGAQRIDIDSDGLLVESDHFSSRMAWSMITKIECTNDHLFAFTGPLNAVIIPRRSLQGAAYDQVRDALVNRGAA